MAFPAIYLTGLATARRLVDADLTRVLAPVLALSIWLIAIHILALATASFFSGLTLGTLVTACAYPFIVSSNYTLSKTQQSRRSYFVRLAVVMLATLPVVWMAIGWNFHDEIILTGHRSIPAQILNDIYPPRHLSFPAQELGYHYGFNLLTACISAIFRIPVWLAIDVASISLWFLTACLLGAMGDRLLGRRYGWIAIIAVLFGGGIPFCLSGGPHGMGDVLGFCRINQLNINIPIISNFFQYPWALGYPLSIATWLVFIEAKPGNVRLIVLSMLMVVLAFSQVVMFLVLATGLGICELWTHLRERRSKYELFSLIASGVVVIIIVIGIGGFFRATPWQGSMPFQFRPGIAPGHNLMWHLQSFGVMLPLGILGFFTLPSKARTPLIICTAICLVVLNFLEYRYSHDGVKFGVGAGLALGIGAAAGIAFIAKHARPAVMVLVLAMNSAAGIAFAFAFCFLRTPPWKFEEVMLASDDAQAANFLRGRVRGSEVVYRRPERCGGYVLLAGLPTVWIDWGVTGFGFPVEWTVDRAKILLTNPAQASAWKSKGIVWFVLEQSDVVLNARADTWILAGDAVEAARFGDVRIVNIR